MESVGIEVVRIPPEKWWPLHKAASVESDIIHLDWPHDWYTGKNFLTQAIKTKMYLEGLRRLEKRCVVWTAHNLAAHDAKRPGHDHKMMQSLIEQCDGIMVMSESAKTSLKQTYKMPKNVNIKKVFHGHYIDCYPNQTSRNESRKRLSIPSGSFVYLIPGAIKPYKGHLNAIKAFASTSTKGDILLIAGGGPQAFINHLKSEIKNQFGYAKGSIIIKPGFINDDEFQFFFNAADVTVLPFTNVLNSGSLLLSMSFGSPIIAPRMGSIPEIAFERYFFGYECPNPTSTIYNLQMAMAKAKVEIGDTTDKEIIAAEIVNFTKSSYAWETAALELRKWYKKIASA
ncbi:glycosyltransferase [bacterium]|nr:glycosyltransferase [bacterium]